MLPRISAVKTHVKTSYMMKITFMDSISQSNINYGIENPKDIVKIQIFMSLPHSLTTVARLEAKGSLVRPKIYTTKIKSTAFRGVSTSGRSLCLVLSSSIRFFVFFMQWIHIMFKSICSIFWYHNMLLLHTDLGTLTCAMLHLSCTSQ